MRVVKPSEVDRDVPRGVVGGSEISQATTGAVNIYMGLFRVPPGARSRPHYHEGCESAVYMLSGELEVRWGDHLEETVTIGPGDMVYVPPRETHILRQPLRRRAGGVRRGPRLADRGLGRGPLGGGLAPAGARGPGPSAACSRTSSPPSSIARSSSRRASASSP